MFCNNTHNNQPSITIYIEQEIMSSSQCTLAGVVHSALPPLMVLCPYCGFRRSPLSQPVKSGPKPTATSTASSSSFPPTSFNTTAKNKGKAPVFVIDSDSETILDDTKPTNSQITKPFSNEAFLRNKKIVEDSRREGFVRREEKKKLKGRYEVGGRKIATVSDNRAVDIHIGPVKGRASEFEFLGKIQFIHTVYTAYSKISTFRFNISSFSRYHSSAWKYGSLYPQSDPYRVSRLA